MNTSASSLRKFSLWAAIVGLGVLWFGDTAIITRDPGDIFRQLFFGAITPSISTCEQSCYTAFDPLINALLTTISFALQGVTLGAVLGAGLSLVFQHRIVRLFCAVIRAIHELFWALLFIQIFGLTPLTGVLAIAIPYAGTFARVYYELVDETDPTPVQSVSPKHITLSLWVYGRLMQAWPQIMQYNRYRTECAIRSSAVLGFIGLPTIGFHLESAFRQGDYSESAGLLYTFIFLIATLRWWLRSRLLPIYLLMSFLWLPPIANFKLSTLWRFLTVDIIPAPLRQSPFQGDQLRVWFENIVLHAAIPGTIETLGIGLVAFPLTGLVALLLFPLASTQFFKRHLTRYGEFLLMISRSIPEYILAFIVLLILGPSWIPALFALSLHNGAIIAHLLANISNNIRLRPDATRGINRYGYEVLPRLYRQFLALLFYRWEIILRETAILGILGLHTLGFYIDSAFETFRFDQAFILIIITAIMNIGADQLSRTLRNRFKLNNTPYELSS
ncbi:MAG: hypothetical protein KUG82_15740 [Pseudomonadales bacterium]|nr:hypothetical protein [Pseudomonadales bacterium]